MRTVKKPWGSELIWAETDRYLGKILKIKAGHRTSLQYHENKLETIYVLSGTVLVNLDENGVVILIRLDTGKALTLKPLQRHRFEALGDCEVLEVSSPEIDDVVRLDDDYGRTRKE